MSLTAPWGKPDLQESWGRVDVIRCHCFFLEMHMLKWRASAQVWLKFLGKTRVGSTGRNSSCPCRDGASSGEQICRASSPVSSESRIPHLIVIDEVVQPFYGMLLIWRWRKCPDHRATGHSCVAFWHGEDKRELLLRVEIMTIIPDFCWYLPSDSLN